jgi:TolA-binding protein
VPPATLNAAIPAELERIISKAIEKDRNLRYQTAADIRADLQRLKRDSGTRMSVAIPAVAAAPTATVVVPATQSNIAAASGASASAASPSPFPSASAVTSTAAAPRFSTAAIVVMVIGAVAVVAVLGSVVTTRWALNNPDIKQVIAEAAKDVAAELPAAVAAPAAPPAPSSAAPPPPVSAPAVAAPAAAAAALPAKGRGTTAKTPPLEASAPKTPPAPVVSPAEATAAERLAIAQEKIASNLLGPALADLRQIVVEFPTTRAAADAAFIGASLLEKQGKLDDAMAAHLEFNRRFGADKRAADSKLRLADLTARSRHPNREVAARDLLNEVVRDYPGTPQAFQALQTKIRVEGDRRQMREMDPVLGRQVPSVIVSLRTLTEQFPATPAAMIALNRLAALYGEENEFEKAAQTLSELATRFGNAAPDAWFRAGEIYERRVKDPVRAKDAYEKVPPTSPRYRDAQRKLNRR